jgi:Tol biopolymer transport system component
VTSFPAAEGKWQISNEIGYNPMWSRSGNEIFYINGNRIMSVQVETTPGFKAGTPQLLFESSSFFGTPPRNSVDVSPDGKKFVVVQSGENMFIPKQINLFLHFSDAISRLAPANH